MASDGGKKLLAVTDAEAAALAAAAKAGSPPTAPPRQAVHVPYTYQVCQGDGSPDPSGLAACDIVHPQADGTWTASGSGKIRSASTDRLLCRFAGDDGSGSGVWEPVGGGGGPIWVPYLQTFRTVPNNTGTADERLAVYYFAIPADYAYRVKCSARIYGTGTLWPAAYPPDRARRIYLRLSAPVVNWNGSAHVWSSGWQRVVSEVNTPGTFNGAGYAEVVTGLLTPEAQTQDNAHTAAYTTLSNAQVVVKLELRSEITAGTLANGNAQAATVEFFLWCEPIVNATRFVFHDLGSSSLAYGGDPVKVSGRAFVDMDNDGVYDAGTDTYLAGRAVTVRRTAFQFVEGVNVLDGDDALPDLKFRCVAAPDGFYTVWAPPNQSGGYYYQLHASADEHPDDATDYPDYLRVETDFDTATSDVTNLHVTLTPTYLVSGTVFDDVDADGVKGVGEAGLPGREVTYTPSGTVRGVPDPVTVTSAADGTYSLRLPPGSYTATVAVTGGETASPASLSVSVTNADVTGRDLGIA